MGTQAITLSNWQSLATYVLPGGTYNKDQLGLGSLMVRRNDAGNAGKWLGPGAISIARIYETNTSNAPGFVHVIPWSSSIDWVFFADNSAAGTTRRLIFYEFDKVNWTWTYKGFITNTMPTATNYTVRAMRMTYDKHTAGTVAVSGTGVTGTGTTWLTDTACAGNRIGFGSTDPTQITTWYEIASLTSDTVLTLTTSAGTIAGGTPYVIEDLRCVQATTNATTTNGGLCVTKGLQYALFTTTGNTVSAATTVDNQRAVYWLADAATVTNITAGGIVLEPATSKASQICWVTDGTTSIKLFKYNLRAALTGLAAGKSTSAWLLASAAQAVTGTATQSNNGRYAVASHGPGNGLACGYLTTSTRIYRTVALATITNGGNWQADAMTEVPPGGTVTFAATAALNNIEYAATLDRFLVASTSGSGLRCAYLTQYRTDGGQMDHILLGDTKQIDQSTVDPTTTPHLTTTGSAFSFWVEGGLCYAVRLAGAVSTSIAYVWPLGADWAYAGVTGQRVILPSLTVSNVNKFGRVFFAHAEQLGGSNLGLPTEPLRIYYRTSGIADNSGAWTLVDDTGDLSAVAVASEIQFLVEFRVMGFLGIPSRLYAVCLTYDDTSTDSHYQPSVGVSSTTSKRFAWRHAVAFGGNVPALRIRLYDAVLGTLLLDDNTDTPTGTWERSTNGGSSWSAWSTADKSNETTYLRYTPASLADNIRVRAILTLK